jgi:hypothetical protein
MYFSYRLRSDNQLENNSKKNDIFNNLNIYIFFLKTQITITYMVIDIKNVK